MAEDSLVQTVEKLLESPGGLILAQLREHLRTMLKVYLAIFCLGFLLAFPITRLVVEFLIAEHRLPDGASIIVVTPVEFLMIQLRIASSFGLALIVIFAIIQLLTKGRHHPAIQQRLSELEIQIPKPGLNVLVVAFFSITLMVLGVWYSWEILTPMLLDYLSKDAQQVGLATEWRLSGYIGFVVNLALASAIGFQTPLITLMAIRLNVVERALLSTYRRHIWFAAFVFGALLSPPDPLSLFLVAIPVIVTFEASLSVSRLLRW